MEDEPKTVYDLKDRLLDFGATIITLTRSLSADYAQLLRAALLHSPIMAKPKARNHLLISSTNSGYRSKSCVSRSAGSNSSSVPISFRTRRFHPF